MQRKPKQKRKCIRGCPAQRRREACIYQHCTRCKKPPGMETPVNSGNKKMIKSDLMSRRRQAKTHICHSETDVTAPPSHFSLFHSHSSSHSLTHYTLPSLMCFFFVFFFRSQAHIINLPSHPSSPPPLLPLSPQITCTHPFSFGFCCLSAGTHIICC